MTDEEITAKFEQLDNSIGSLITDLNALQDLCSSYNDHFSALDSSVNDIENSLLDFSNNISTLKDDVSTLKDDVSTLKDDVSILKEKVRKFGVGIGYALGTGAAGRDMALRNLHVTSIKDARPH